jgi:hypothetical protein
MSNFVYRFTTRSLRTACPTEQLLMTYDQRRHLLPTKQAMLPPADKKTVLTYELDRVSARARMSRVVSLVRAVGSCLLASFVTQLNTAYGHYLRWR